VETEELNVEEDEIFIFRQRDDGNQIPLRDSQRIRRDKVFATRAKPIEAFLPVRIEIEGEDMDFPRETGEEIRRQVKKATQNGRFRLWGGAWEGKIGDIYDGEGLFLDCPGVKNSITLNVGQETLEVMAESMRELEKNLCLEFGWEHTILRDNDQTETNYQSIRCQMARQCTLETKATGRL
jgi:hypothetical protein